MLLFGSKSLTHRIEARSRPPDLARENVEYVRDMMICG